MTLVFNVFDDDENYLGAVRSESVDSAETLASRKFAKAAFIRLSVNTSASENDLNSDRNYFHSSLAN